MGGGMMALCAVAFGLYLPRRQYLRTSVRVADTLRRHTATGPGEVIMLDYKEPSLAFYEGGTIRENPNLVLTDKLLQSAPPWMVITRDVWQSPKTEEAARRKLEVVQTVRGLDIAEEMRRRRSDGGAAEGSPDRRNGEIRAPGASDRSNRPPRLRRECTALNKLPVARRFLANRAG